MYDFVAERDDELSALKDEPVLIQAISTEDWCGASSSRTNLSRADSADTLLS